MIVLLRNHLFVYEKRINYLGLLVSTLFLFHFISLDVEMPMMKTDMPHLYF